jgi:4-amino-4-deoxy-L-arabinose transferase-like glycosyltransferase/DNA-directed RNA polymerase subunit RPC12/RpoP
MMSPPSPEHGPQTQPATAVLALFFPCSACGKKLRVKAELAGTKIKCPQCGQCVLAPQLRPSAPAPVRAVPVVPTWLILGLVLLATFALKLRNLDHTALTRWDEVFHAIVAQNLLKHPLQPTLIDAPFLPYSSKNWHENHVWLHKPILPLWQIALSFAALGVDTLALRFPAVLLSTAAAWLTFLIGKRLFDSRTALVAASLQALSPFLMKLVHGYQFADSIDLALLFWVEVGIYFLVRALPTGRWRYVLLAGVAQGLAFLCKSYLAAIIFGIALTAWLLPLCRLAKRADCRIGPAALLGLLGATLVTVAPWLGYCASEYPEEFWHEHAQVWRHLNTNVENWAAPWDRVVFDYLIAMYGVFYTPILVALVALLGKLAVQRPLGLWLVYAWGLGVVLPHLGAVTKTPSATVLALPAFFLLLGHLIAEAWRGERWPLAALTGVLVMCVLVPAVINPPGHGYPQPRVVAGVMWQSLWVIDHVAGALLIAWILTRRCLSPGSAPLRRDLRLAALAFSACVLAWLGSETVRASWDITSADVNDPVCEAVGEFAREKLSENGVLLWDERRGDEHLATMFYAGRTCYALEGMDPDVKARQIIQAGGIPYVVSYRRLPFSSVLTTGARGPTIYRWEKRSSP